jgi:hypothetical protein
MMTCPAASAGGDTEDQLVDAATAHLAEKHPDMVGVYERHHILFMSVLLPKCTLAPTCR